MISVLHTYMKAAPFVIKNKQKKHKPGSLCLFLTGI